MSEPFRQGAWAQPPRPIAAGGGDDRLLGVLADSLVAIDHIGGSELTPRAPRLADGVCCDNW